MGKAALANADVPNTCSGAIQPDVVYPCSSLPVDSTNTYTFSLSQATDLVFVRVTATDGETLPFSVTGPGGSDANCQFIFFPTLQCTTSEAGTYMLQVQSAGIETAYTVTYTPLLSDATCTALTDGDVSFASPALTGTLVAGSNGNCYTLDQPVGTVLRTLIDGPNVTADIYDASGALVCGGVGDCTLTGAGPYRALVGTTDASASTYQWGLFRISNAIGCVAINPQPYGVVPDTNSTNRCRSLHVATAGLYQIDVVTADGSIQFGTIYDASGTQVCSSGGGPCELPAGDDALVLIGPLSNQPAFGVIFIAGSETRGCTPVSDTGFADGAATGSSTGTEDICLSLPTASGEADSIFNGLSENVTQPDVQVVDSTGAQVCENFDFGFDTCKLIGTAPFNIVLSFAGPGAYQILVQRADSASGCTNWPQSGYGGTPGVQVTLKASFRAACLAIPANQHSTGEMIDYTNTTNVLNAGMTVLDPTGTQVCLANSLGLCSLKSGVAYTAILSSPSAVDTYKLVRRDMSASATCGSPKKTAPAGPSNKLTLTSALDARCIRLTAAASDDLLMGVRTATGSDAGAVLFVADNAGKVLCRQFGVPCRVSGSTSYQVIVVASNFAGTSITAHLDTWRVGTSAGWASQCTAHQIGSAGFAPFSSTLTESRTGYCAVVSVRPSEVFGVYGVTSAPRPQAPWVSMLGSADWTGSDYCGNQNFGDLSFQCQVPPTSPGQAVLILYPFTTDLPVSFTVQGFCEANCVTAPAPPTITRVTPRAGKSGQVAELTVTGSGLTMGDQVSLTSNGSAVTAGESTPVIASADGTSLTVRLSLFGVNPGKYDVKVTTPTFATATLPTVFHVS